MESQTKNRRTVVAAGLAVAVGVALIVGLSSGALALGGPFTGNFESPALEQNETMPNFFDGKVVNSEYEQNYFVGSWPAVPSLGVAPTISPVTSAKGLDNMYVLVPAWGCVLGSTGCTLAGALAPAFNASTPAQCPVATVMTCFDHPATINVNAVIPGAGSVPLPAHDHLLPGIDSYQDIWWLVYVVLVLNVHAWPGLAGPTGITSVANVTGAPVVAANGSVTESLTQALLDGDAFGPVVTNFYLDFGVNQPGSP